jgi:hypothetical protein
MGAKGSKNTRSVKTPIKQLDPAVCKDCKTPYPTAEHWCKVCNGKHFVGQFKEWSSGNEDIDTFIREAQTNAAEPGRVLEWIPFDKLEDIEKKGRGGFGTVYHAKWKEGYIRDWDSSRKQWNRSGLMDVVLKSLDNSEDISLDYLKEVNNIIFIYVYTFIPQKKEYNANPPSFSLLFSLLFSSFLLVRCCSCIC